MSLHTELWFPSVVWSGMVHRIDNTALKKFAYERKKNDVGVTISNYGGWQSSPLSPGDCEEIDALVEYLNVEVDNCRRQVGLASLELYNIWININPPHSYNHLHNHADAVLSGVYYVDAPEHSGNIQFERGDNAEYHIPDYVEQQTYYTSTRATYRAKAGAVYIFPGWLKHSVQGNKTNVDRISIAFNYGDATDET